MKGEQKMRTDYNKLKEKLQFVYAGRMDEFPKGKSIETAIKVYKDVKKYEKTDGDGEVDYNRELLEAKYDLQIIFNINFKGLTKNNIYLTHQSMWVNSVYIMLNEGEN